MANPRILRQIAGDLRRAATELELQAEEMEEGGQAKAVLDRSCQGKRRYVTPEGAGQAAADRGEPNLRVYRCEFCGDYHLTSKPFDRHVEGRG